MEGRTGVGPSATSIVSPSIPIDKWKQGLQALLSASDPYYPHVQLWKSFCRGAATAASFTNLKQVNPCDPSGRELLPPPPSPQQTLQQQLSKAGFDVALNATPHASCGHAVFFGTNDIHPSHADCQHWAAYERLGQVLEDSGSEYVVQLFNKKPSRIKTKNADGTVTETTYLQFTLKFVCLYLPKFVPRLGQHRDCASLKFIAHGSYGGAFRLSYLAGQGVQPALKSCIVKRNDIDFTSFKPLMREKAFLADIDHPNIVKLHYQYVSPNYDSSSMGAQNTVFFIEEDGGRTVQGYLREIYFNHQAQPVPVQMIYRVCVDILQALVYLESRGILHRDIKGDNVVISVFPDSDAAAARPDFVAKLIDFGLARRHEGSGKMEYDVGRYNAACEVAAEDVSDAEGVGVTEGGDSKLGIAGANTITQHAPECCEAPATKPQRASRFYSHKSDVWAFGTMVVWELMYCACGANIEDMRKSNSITGRMYNKPVPDKNAEELDAAWDTANVSTDALRERIASKLRQRYTASGPRSEDERRMFETLCDVLQGMCEGNHDIRASAAASLERLCGGTGSAAHVPVAPLARASDFSTFSHLCKFMDSFCSSGHLHFSCKKLQNPDSSHSFRFGSVVDVCYDVVPSVPWLFRRRMASPRDPQLEEHVPDYFVKPPTANCPKPYGLFLPRNAFSKNAEKSVFRIENLVYLAQGEWFTVFRYSGGDEPIIIKRANIFPLSFKYLLREKAMLGYLNHRNIARPISLDKLGLKKPAPGLVDGGFYPLACLGGKEEYWNDTYFMYEDGGASLKEWLHSSREISLADVKSIALQLLEVLIYLQNMQVVHRDIRMESFVWSKHTLKLISLGKAKHMEPSTQEELDAVEQFEQEWAKPHESRAIPGFATTPSSFSLLPMKRESRDEGYMAPDAMADGATPSYSWDWYGAGQVLLKLLQRCPDDGDCGERAEIQKIAEAMHNDDEINREDYGNPSDLIKKLNPHYQEIKPAADGRKCSKAVFAFIQSFFSTN